MLWRSMLGWLLRISIIGRIKGLRGCRGSMMGFFEGGVIEGWEGGVAGS